MNSSFKVLMFLSFLALSNLINAEKIKVVKDFNVKKYMGKWHEIARKPNSFQKKDSYNVQAVYELKKFLWWDYVSVMNSEYSKGKKNQAKGIALQTKEKARLKVSFFLPFFGEYAIIDLDKDYQYAIVGESDKENLWILSRKPKMEDVLYQALLKKVKDEFGYDVSDMYKSSDNYKEDPTDI